MEAISLTGAEKSRLRGRGQQIAARVNVGKEGLTPAIIRELRRQLQAQDLVKVRFVGSDRHARASLCPEISRATGSAWVGSVGATALFFLPRAGDAPAPVSAPTTRAGSAS